MHNEPTTGEAGDMTMKRYIARDMRAAMRQIRAEQGADAVILSTQQVPGGVEVCAASDLAAAAAATLPTADTAAAAIDTQTLRALSGVGEVATQETNTELRSLRRLLETHLAALAWNDFTRRDPLRSRALTELTQLGVARDVAWSVVKELPPDLDAEQAQQQHFTILARRLQVCDSPVEAGGVFALLGPPGSGKSTTLAKLAVRWVMARGADSLALVSADSERIGSGEQLRTLGRLLGADTCLVEGAHALGAQLEALAHKELVLVDTAGVQARDEGGMAALAELLAAVPSMVGLLVLPASAQAAVIDDCLARFKPLQPSCAVLTRLDEAASLGGTLAALIRAQLPVALQSAGARIPDDLAPARAEELVQKAIESALAHPASVDEDLLAQRFGGSLHAAA
jgi:flagellar biosynthesis protein FlhF